MGRCKKLEVWQLSKDLAVQIIQTTENGPLKNRVGLKDPLQRSSLGVPSNVAEGKESGSNPNAIRYFRIAKGSLAELRTQLTIYSESDLIDLSLFEDLHSKAELTYCS